jgi:hypothetical protein
MSGWTVEWIPYELGIYSIEIKYGPSHVVGSPFKCKVFDISKVIIIRDYSGENSLLKSSSVGLSPEAIVFFGEAASFKRTVYCLIVTLYVRVVCQSICSYFLSIHE